MAVDIPPLDDLMDIDEPFELEAVGCSLGPSEKSCLLEEMEICPPSPACSSRVLRLEEASVDRCVLPVGMDVYPPSPARSSCFLPLAEADTPSAPFVRPSAVLVAPPAPSASLSATLATPSVPSATGSATLATTPSAPFVSVATAAAMAAVYQYRRPASPPSRDETPPKASRDGTPLGNENQLSPVNVPVAPLEDVEDIDRMVQGSGWFQDLDDVCSQLTAAFAEREEENLQPSLEQIGEEEFDRFLADFYSDGVEVEAGGINDPTG